MIQDWDTKGNIRGIWITDIIKKSIDIFFMNIMMICIILEFTRVMFVIDFPCVFIPMLIANFGLWFLSYIVYAHLPINETGDKNR